MNVLDFVLIIIFFFAAFEGFRRGFISELLHVAAFVIVLVISFKYYHQVGDWLAIRYHVSALLAKPIGFLSLWFGTELIMGIVVKILNHLLPNTLSEAHLNRLAGLVLSLVKTAIYSGILLAILVALPLPANVKDLINQSRLSPKLISSSGYFTHRLEQALGTSLVDTFNFLTSPPDLNADESKAIPVITDQAKLLVEAQFEQQMLELVNQERGKVGAKALVMDEPLRTIARAHSKDMWERGYFAHNTPEGQTPFDRMQAAGITYTVAGENLALAPTVAIAHQGLMNSPGHRKNILDPAFGRVGIGIIAGGADGLMITQDFRD